MDSLDSRYFVEKHSNLWCVLRKGFSWQPIIMLAYDDEDQAQRICEEYRKGKRRPIETYNFRSAEVRGVFLQMNSVSNRLVYLESEFAREPDDCIRRWLHSDKVHLEIAIEHLTSWGFTIGGIAS